MNRPANIRLYPLGTKEVERAKELSRSLKTEVFMEWRALDEGLANNGMVSSFVFERGDLKDHRPFPGTHFYGPWEIEYSWVDRGKVHREVVRGEW